MPCCDQSGQGQKEEVLNGEHEFSELFLPRVKGLCAAERTGLTGIFNMKGLNI